VKPTPLLARALVFALALCACDRPSARAEASASLFASTPDVQWRLPDELREISGLAVSADGRLFGHDDERAIIYEIDAAEGRVLKAFTMGDVVQRGDFEGLAITDAGDFWIVTSEGRLLRFREAENGGHAPFEVFDSGLFDTCEVEGLAFLAADESLILACKRNQARSMRDTILLYTWRPGAAAATPWVSLPEAQIAQMAGVRSFRPSSVEVDRASSRIILLSADDNAVAELSQSGELIAARALGRQHVQAEGVAVVQGSLVIADEGAGQRALLSRYPPAS
jgi:uncharacterized protein YjiK